MRRSLLPLPAFVALAFALCLSLSVPSVLLAQTPIATTPGIRIADMDLAVDPAVDFYRYANGGWPDRTRIPSDWESYGVFEQLMDKTEDQLIALLGGLSDTNTLTPGSDEWKAVRFYEQGLDLTNRNAEGIAPIQPYLDAIDGATDLLDLHKRFATTKFLDIPGLYNFLVVPGFFDSNVFELYFVGPQLGLPAVEFYTDDNPVTESAREIYHQAAANLFELVGMSQPDATATATAVYEFEASMAEHMVNQVDSQNLYVTYNPRSIDELAKTYPSLDWLKYVHLLGAEASGSTIIINTQLELLEHLQVILETTPLDTIKNYLKLRLFFASKNLLSEDFRDATFEYRIAVEGVVRQVRTEGEVLLEVNQRFGLAVGKAYVAEYFPLETKAQVMVLVDDMIAAFRTRLETNSWMAAETRAKALEKLDNMGRKVGYPDKWRSYEAVDLGKSFFQTAHHADIAEIKRVMAMVGQPVDPTEWQVSPQTINAFYDFFNNEIVFPAAFLQPPVFDPNADPASNYGAIGFMIGHEITHGFDLQGGQLDADGNFVNWWSEADFGEFQALNDRVATQYGAIEVLPGLNVDGQLTVTENVADMGGAQVAFDALQLALAQNGDPGLIDGLTQSQRFFIAAAGVWRQKAGEEILTMQILSDPHSPGSVRGTLPLQNMDAFYEAFGIVAGDPMYLPPKDRIVVW